MEEVCREEESVVTDREVRLRERGRMEARFRERGEGGRGEREEKVRAERGRRAGVRETRVRLKVNQSAQTDKRATPPRQNKRWSVVGNFGWLVFVGRVSSNASRTSERSTCCVLAPRSANRFG